MLGIKIYSRPCDGPPGGSSARQRHTWLSITCTSNYSDVTKTASNFYYFEITRKLLRKCFQGTRNIVYSNYYQN